MPVASVTVAGGAMVLFALEGLICIAMALPIAWVIAWPGAVMGRIMARRHTQLVAGTGMALFVPLLLGIEPRAQPPAHEVVTIVEIAAPPQQLGAPPQRRRLCCRARPNRRRREHA